MESVASRLAVLMKKRGFNQPRLAEAASGLGEGLVSQQVVQHLLSGRNQNSKHLVAIARALGTSSDWLQSGRHPKARTAVESLLVGKVGAGSEITRFEDGVVLEAVEAPPGIQAPNAAVIHGDSQYPLQEGWRIFYGPEHQGVAEDCLGKLCVVQVKDGPTLLKTLKRGSRRGLFRLESWNAPPREDVKLAWAAKVIFIQPR
jgi:phage repressor protein C with HTH and peptisase S24 domain